MKAQGLRENLPEIFQACSLFFILIQASDNEGGWIQRWERNVPNSKPVKVKIINFPA
jgi:hypothetical protein